MSKVKCKTELRSLDLIPACRVDDGDAGGRHPGGVLAGHAGLPPRIQVRRKVQGGIHVEQDGALQVR